MLGKLIRAGMNVARINMSHGDVRRHETNIRTIRSVADKLGVPVAVLLDLPGPRYRTGELKAGKVSLKKGSRIVLTSRNVPGDEYEVSLNLPGLTKDVSPGDSILLDDGAIRLLVDHKTDTDVVCDVVVGGVLKPRRGIAVPGIKLSVPYMSKAMRKQLKFGIRLGVEYIALSYVSRASDISQVKSIISKVKKPPSVIAKIERQEAVRNFRGILKASDGIMVARGDLGVDITLEKVPIVQKEIIARCNRAGKPVITATQMLESMIKASRPTRAEVADVANAIWDGTDAVMLSAETAIGAHPVEAVAMMSGIARETESALPYERRLAERGDALEPHTDDAIAYDACSTAHQLDARAIVAFTESGSTAWRVCKYRPKVPVLAITPDNAVQRKLALAWGVYTYRQPSPSNVDHLFTRGCELARELRAANESDLIVITCGVPIGVKGTTNLLKVHEV
jgi:pyruvate kinase